MEPRYIRDNAEWETLADELKVNQYVINGEKAMRWDGEKFVDLCLPNIHNFKARNVEQRCLIDLLNNDAIGGKVVDGVAGSGKTKCALKVGLHKVMSGKYGKLVIIRNPVEVGEKLGFLPGNDTAKLEPWRQPIIDCLEGGEQQYDRLVSEGQLEFGPIAYVQGRTIDNAFIIVTEGQNMNFDHVKMCGTRVGDKTVIVIEGDDEQIASEEFKQDNGLRLAPIVYGGNPEFGYMRLTKTVRSKVAAMFAQVYKPAR